MKKMKLSTAMLWGAKRLPKCTEDFFRYDGKGNAIASCALGAAYHGYYGEPNGQP
jgi:hypothetical protein